METLFKVYETEEFLNCLKKIGFEQIKIEKKLKSFVYPQLKINPFFGLNIKKLKNYNPDTWRYRVGKYRLFYEVNLDEKIIYMTAADHRKDCY